MSVLDNLDWRKWGIEEGRVTDEKEIALAGLPYLNAKWRSRMRMIALAVALLIIILSLILFLPLPILPLPNSAILRDGDLLVAAWRDKNIPRINEKVEVNGRKYRVKDVKYLTSTSDSKVAIIVDVIEVKND